MSRTVSFLMGALMSMMMFGAEAQNINFSFSNFDAANAGNFLMVNDAKHDVANASFVLNPSQELDSSCGKLLYREKVQMIEASSSSSFGKVASFHTSFTFQISAPRAARGDGLSFVLARSDSFHNETAGQSLCLVNRFRNGDKLFAVEFDSSWNPAAADPSDSHIGVDVNSVMSSWSHNLCGDRVSNCSYLTNGGRFTAWIDFDSGSHNLEVFFSSGTVKPQLPVITASIPSFADLVDEFMYIGFVGSSSGGSGELHEIQSWMFASTGVGGAGAAVPVGGGGRKASRAAMVGGIVAAAAIVIALAAAWVCYRKWSLFRTRDKRMSLLGEGLTPQNFTYKKLSKATRGFSRSELLGRGGFGAVFKGSLDGEVVAVKRMRMESADGLESFQAEVASLSQIRHRNLVQLRGWCHEGDALMLVYDYMRHGSLDDWLHQFVKQNAGAQMTLAGQQSLPLALRYSILRGVAAGLLYLHEECAQCVLHRDIKSSNVLLDGDWNAYLGDFGLARVVDHQKLEKTTMMAGTLGYMAPEMSHTGKATKETDVYAFGVLVLEAFSGMRPLAACGVTQGPSGILVDSVWRAHEAGNILRVADATLDVKIHDGDAAKKTIQNMLHLGLLCCNSNAEDRPIMRLVNQLLQSDRDMTKYMPALPDCKPQFHYARYGYPDANSSSAPSFPDLPLLGSSLSFSGVLSEPHPDSFCATDITVLVGR